MNDSLGRTAQPSLPGAEAGYTDRVAPFRFLPRCQPMAIALLPAGHGCSVCTWMQNSNLVAFKLFLSLANIL